MRIFLENILNVSEPYNHLRIITDYILLLQLTLVEFKKQKQKKKHIDCFPFFLQLQKTKLCS